MTLNRIVGATLLLLIAAVARPSATSVGGAALSAGAGIPCPFQPFQYYLVCYTPQQKAIAQHRFAGRQLDPSHIVKRLSGKALTGLVDGQPFVGPDLRTSRKVTWLEYDFGPVPGYYSPTPTPTVSATPVATATPVKWSKVVEHPPPFLKLKGIRISNSSWDGARWELDEELLVRYHLAISIFSNERKSAVMAMGHALMKKDKRG